MAVRVDLDPAGRHIVEQFGPYSINTEVRDTEGRLVLHLHDSGSSVKINTFTPQDDTAVARLLQEAEVVFVVRRP